MVIKRRTLDPRTRLPLDNKVSGARPIANEARVDQSATVEPLSTHVESSAPAPTGAGGGVLGLRLGQFKFKRAWNKLQALVGVGDASALGRASEIVAQTRAEERALSRVPSEAMPAAFSDLRQAVQSATGKERKALDKARRKLAALQKSGADIEAQLLVVDDAAIALRQKEREVLDANIPAAFALASEASWRELKMRPYDEQLQAGALLVRGKLVEQYTGEGKTLSAIAPAVLAAMNGRGVHLATSSNYLARRDAETTAPAFGALGLSVAALLPDGSAVRFDPPGTEAVPCDRKAAYLADVTYGTAAQFGFDYLRDNLATRDDDKVQRGNPTLIMDEVDSLLIDDAKTPLVISGPPQEAFAEERSALALLVEGLKLGEDIEFDKNEGFATLSEAGIDRVCASLDITPAELQAQPLVSFVSNAVKARALFQRDVDYIVDESGGEGGRIELIGQNGEVLNGRRLGDGLHQAIEAREAVEILPESATLGSIGLRDYLGLYDHVAGMTGTAEVSAGLFGDIYGLDVVRVKTHRDLRRVDHDPELFATVEAKAMRALTLALEAAADGRPVVVGCPDEKTAAELSRFFSAHGAAHQCLNAKSDEEAAALIADAGIAGQITITTPIGGRGVDIKLGGKDASDDAREAVRKKGGLRVVCFEPNETERIDNQLRGRAARQGDQGETFMLASAEDRFFARKPLPRAILKRLAARPEGALTGPDVNRLVDDHSALGESLLHQALKDALPLDGVIEQHRRRWQHQRRLFVTGDVLEGVRDIAASAVDRLLSEVADLGAVSEQEAFAMYTALAHVVPLEERSSAPEGWAGSDAHQLQRKIVTHLDERLEAHLDTMGPAAADILQSVVLSTVDQLFVEHRDNLDIIRRSMSLQQYAQKEAKNVFPHEAEAAWIDYMAAVRHQIGRVILGSMSEPPAS